MASGTVALVRTGNGYLQGQIVWSSTSNGSAANTSSVTAELQIRRSALNTTTGTFKGTFTVGSTSETISWYGSLPSMEWITIKTITVTIGHNADGNGSCYLYAIVNGPGATSMEGTYVSGASTVTLDWIPRFASIVSVTDFTDEGNPVITYSNPAGSAVSLLQACISLTGAKDDVQYRDIPKTGTSYTFQLTEDERNMLRAATPNSNTLTVYVYIQSTIGGSTSGVYKTAIMSIVNADPAIAPTVVDTNSATIAVTGDSSILVALRSTAKVTINASAKKYASIASRRVEHGSAVLMGDGTVPVTNNPINITATDSRGNSVTKTAANTIVPYINPTCSIGNNIPETDGSYALEVTGLFYNGAIGMTANALTVQYCYKPAGGSYSAWTTFDSVTINGNSYTAVANLTGLDYRTVYTFQARAIDAIYVAGVWSAEKAVIAEPVFDWSKDDFRFNVPVNIAAGGVRIWTDTEGGNIRVIPEENAPVDYWDMDANNGIFRIFAYKNETDTNGKGYVFPLALHTDGSIAVGNPKKTREHIGAAPDGYGLGGNCKTIDSVKNIPGNGWWFTNGDTPDGSYWFCHSRHSSDNSTIIVDAWRSDGKHQAILVKNDTWGEWEWINPALNAGVEYRTTERWYSYPVYVKMIDMGALPNNSTKTVYVSDHANGGRIISATGFENASGQRIPTACFGSSLSLTVGITFSVFSLSLTTNFDGSAYTQAFITAKYIKY